MSKILAIDSSKGMVDLYNATWGSDRECAMGAVQGDLIAGVLLERGEGDGAGMLGVPGGLEQGCSVLGFCVRCQTSNLEFCKTYWSGILIESFSSASISSAHLLFPTIAKISSSALSKDSFSRWRITVFFSSSTLRK